MKILEKLKEFDTEAFAEKARRIYEAKYKMEQVRTNIVIDGKSYWSLFNKGVRNTYVKCNNK